MVSRSKTIWLLKTYSESEIYINYHKTSIPKIHRSELTVRTNLGRVIDVHVLKLRAISRLLGV